MSILEELENSHLSAGNQNYIEDLYEQYLSNPNSVPENWRKYFHSISNGLADEIHSSIRKTFKDLAYQKTISTVLESPKISDDFRIQTEILKLIQAYRAHGHHQAKLDPLNLTERRDIPDLELSHYRFNINDSSVKVNVDNHFVPKGAPLSELYQALRYTYCNTIGVEYLHITDTNQTEWIEQKIESVQSHPILSKEEKITILKQLTAAEGLERYLGTRFVGQKRFSLEGGESLIPLLQEIIQCSGKDNVKDIVLAMAHRGRLNVLINILGKSPESLFEEFEGKKQPQEITGDVKYHMGFSADVKVVNRNIHLALAFNPSHLEIVSPVVEGSVRARQVRRNDSKREQVIPIIIHGDAAFAGQGVVMETFNFSQARGYATGGSIHIIINNQIGFTTSNPLDARSTLYCSDIAKMVQAPVFHVNTDDPEAVIFVTRLAYEFRMKFKKDVVIDLVGYRRHGHNEADDPSITQPVMYQIIKSLPTAREKYADKLIKDNIISNVEVELLVNKYKDALDQGNTVVNNVAEQQEDDLFFDWSPYLNKQWTEPAVTKVSKEKIMKLGKQLHQIPKDFSLHHSVKKLWSERLDMAQGNIPMNWGFAELMAYATLLDEGYAVRMSGQDVGRGTFAHRHAIIYDTQTGSPYIPLRTFSKQSEQFTVIDSILSEEAVLAFEYGYATAEPKALVIWEAQFGDFANGAQVVIDQFISSGEQKWGRLCGLVMLLPHGMEGQGPEHSSARLERYLQLCAQHNMQVCVPTTPAQAFHMLRRQVIRNLRKPLIVLTPKSLLRHKEAVSTLAELANGEFQLIIPEIDKINSKDVKRVILCSGKVFYELLQFRSAHDIKDAVILRIEQLYPFPEAQLREQLEKYKHAKLVIWCQEEPQNQGAWFSSQHHMKACLTTKQELVYVGREMYASPAVGNAKLHVIQQQKLIADAFEKQEN